MRANQEAYPVLIRAEASGKLIMPMFINRKRGKPFDALYSQVRRPTKLKLYDRAKTMGFPVFKADNLMTNTLYNNQTRSIDLTARRGALLKLHLSS